MAVVQIEIDLLGGDQVIPFASRDNLWSDATIHVMADDLEGSVDIDFWQGNKDNHIDKDTNKIVGRDNLVPIDTPVMNVSNGNTYKEIFNLTGQHAEARISVGDTKNGKLLIYIHTFQYGHTNKGV